MQPHPSGWQDDDEPSPRIVLSPHERTRISQATADLDTARRADLTQFDTVGLIRLVERLRGSLDDMVQLLSDLQR